MQSGWVRLFNEQKQKLCTPFTCFFTFLARSRQICDVKLDETPISQMLQRM